MTMAAVLDGAAWWATHPVTPTWVQRYRESAAAPHRQSVVDGLASLPPWRSLFEVGCHCGPMLAAIQAAYPNAKLGGCDVNAGAVSEAKADGWTVVEGEFPRLTAHVPDQTFDVVLSCYALAYQAPEALPAALVEMARLARVGVVLCEPMAWDAGEVCQRGGVSFAEWRHPYLAVLKTLTPFHRWVADCSELSFETNHLSGLIVARRP